MESHLLDIVKKATRAASGHNTQPWKFFVDSKGLIVIFPDMRRALPIADADNHALFISLGCALENLLIAAAHFGYETKVELKMQQQGKERITIELTQGVIKSRNPLFDSIDERQSTRNMYDNVPLPDDAIQKILLASHQPDVGCRIISDRTEIDNIVQMVKEAQLIQLKDKHFKTELTKWTRFNKKSAKATGDGLFSGAAGIMSVPTYIGKYMFPLAVSAEREASKSAKLIYSSSALVVFIANRNDKETWINVGRSFERVALTTTALNINNAHVNMPCEVVTVRRKLASYFHLKDGEEPLLLIRLGYSHKMPFSFRRPLSEVLIN